jgi:hypothetical protein
VIYISYHKEKIGRKYELLTTYMTIFENEYVSFLLQFFCILEEIKLLHFEMLVGDVCVSNDILHESLHIRGISLVNEQAQHLNLYFVCWNMIIVWFLLF